MSILKFLDDWFYPIEKNYMDSLDYTTFGRNQNWKEDLNLTIDSNSIKILQSKGTKKPHLVNLKIGYV